jgi:hypothetical protein
MGEKLGEGGFCNVYSCALKKRDKKVIPQACGEGATTRTTTAAAAAHNLDLTLISTDESCAVKFLRREITAHRKNFQVRVGRCAQGFSFPLFHCLFRPITHSIGIVSPFFFSFFPYIAPTSVFTLNHVYLARRCRSCS